MSSREYVLIRASLCGREIAGVESWWGFSLFIRADQCKVQSYPTEEEAERHPSTVVCGRFELATSFLDFHLGAFSEEAEAKKKEVLRLVSTHPEEEGGHPDAPFLICGHAFVQLGGNATLADPTPVQHAQPSRVPIVTLFRATHHAIGEPFINSHEAYRVAMPLATLTAKLPPVLEFSPRGTCVREVDTAEEFESKSNAYTSYMDFYTPSTHEKGEGYACEGLLDPKEVETFAELDERTARLYNTASILKGRMGMCYVNKWGPDLYFYCTEEERPGMVY